MKIHCSVAESHFQLPKGSFENETTEPLQYLFRIEKEMVDLFVRYFDFDRSASFEPGKRGRGRERRALRRRGPRGGRRRGVPRPPRRGGRQRGPHSSGRQCIFAEKDTSSQRNMHFRIEQIAANICSYLGIYSLSTKIISAVNVLTF